MKLIDPTTITNYTLTDDELEAHILFWVCAAGKNGVVAAKCLYDLLNNLENIYGHLSPFELVKAVERQEKSGVAYLKDKLKEAGIGCYNLKATTFKTLAASGLDLRTCSTDDLETIKGIGCKTSRCFIIHSRPNQKLAGLDRHALHYLEDLGYKVPKTTPASTKQYKQVEQWFIQEAYKQGLDVAVLDLKVWNEYRNK